VTGAELATSADVAELLVELRAVRAEVAALSARLPSAQPWISLRAAAERLGVDPRTITAMGERGELVTRRAGRRVLVDAASLRPTARATVQALADAARAGR
jgi:hypothetical protein